MTEAALWSFDQSAIELRFRAFELYPKGEGAGTSRFGATEWDALVGLAEVGGISVRPRASTPRTRKAHEAAMFAREQEREIDLRREIFAALWSGDADIGRIDVLEALATKIGLDGEEMRIALDIDRLEPAVEADEELARRLRIPGTPVVFVGAGPSARVVAGALGPEAVREAIAEWMRDDPEFDADLNNV